MAPTVTLAAGNDLSVDEGSQHTYNFTVSDPGTDTFTVTTADCGVNGSQVGTTSTTASGGSFVCLFPDGPTSSTVSVQVKDSDNVLSNTASQSVSVLNVAPTVDLTGPATTDEGQTKTYDFTVSDPGIDTFGVTVGFPDCGTGGSLVVGSLATTAAGDSFDCLFPDGPASPTVRLRVTDSDDATSNIDTITVTVSNVAPTVDAGAATGTVAEGSTFTRSGSFTDPGADTWTATVNYGDGSGVEP